MNTTNIDIQHWLTISETKGIGNLTFYKLLSHFGLPEHIINASHHSLSQVVGASLASHLKSPPTDKTRKLIDTTITWLEHPNHHLLTLADEHYPKSLLSMPDPPPILYAVGNLTLLQHNFTRNIAIVGSRNASQQGCLDTQHFASELAQHGLNIVSGLALGIDTAAHQGALSRNKTHPNAGSTIAIIGTGADRVYPGKNKQLAHQIAEQGLILSEFPLGTSALQHNFPRRNRIIAGLCQAILVVEAALESGSLITARLAIEQGRDVFALPGSIHSPLSKGCHQLIKSGAKLVDEVNDILSELRLEPNHHPLFYTKDTPTKKQSVHIHTVNTTEHTNQKLTDSQQPNDVLGNTLGYAPLHLDELIVRSGLEAALVNACLLELELEGLVEKLPGGQYRRLNIAQP